MGNDFRLVNFPMPAPEDIKRGPLPWAEVHDGHKPIRPGDRFVMKSGRVYEIMKNGLTLKRIK